MNQSTSQAAVKRYELFLTNLMQWQEVKGMTNPEFSTYCDISHFTWRSMRLGTARTGAYNMLKMSEATGVLI